MHARKEDKNNRLKLTRINYIKSKSTKLSVNTWLCDKDELSRRQRPEGWRWLGWLCPCLTRGRSSRRQLWSWWRLRMIWGRSSRRQLWRWWRLRLIWGRSSCGNSRCCIASHWWWVWTTGTNQSTISADKNLTKQRQLRTDNWQHIHFTMQTHRQVVLVVLLVARQTNNWKVVGSMSANVCVFHSWQVTACGLG